jgi:hypothetical protein
MIKDLEHVLLVLQCNANPFNACVVVGRSYKDSINKSGLLCNPGHIIQQPLRVLNSGEIESRVFKSWIGTDFRRLDQAFPNL